MADDAPPIDQAVVNMVPARAPSDTPVDTPTRVRKGPDLDATREKLAYFLLYILLGVIVVVMIVSLIYSADCWVDRTTCPAANDALGVMASHVTPIFTAMIGLVGSVVGFYFGSKQN